MTIKNSIKNVLPGILFISLILFTGIALTVVDAIGGPKQPTTVVLLKEPITIGNNNYINIKIIAYRTYDGHARVWIGENESDIWEIPFSNIKAIIPIKLFLQETNSPEKLKELK